MNQIGVPHEVLKVPPPPGEDEPVFPNETPVHYVQRTALSKAQLAASWLKEQVFERQMADKPILTADTTVALDAEILGKPTDIQDAFRILSKLSGKTHQVYTSVVLIRETKIRSVLSTSTVTFAAMTQEQIEHYIQTGEPFGKAGAYGIQGRAASFITQLTGSYSGVVGLPLFETALLLSAQH